MAWRESFFRHFGPGLLVGVALGDWLRLLNNNQFAVDPTCFLRALALTFYAVQHSALRRLENWRFGAAVEATTVQPPLFILGHWRSGTTHLHNLITLDQRFAFPNNYQVLFPHTFLTTEERNARLMSSLMPPRRPMDNIEWDMASPQEDEFALCNACLMSPCLAWLFPQHREKFERYLTLRDVSPTEVKRWQQTLLWFLKKVTFKYGRPLVLKSPPHTCRIRLLLDLFPQARFVHIHRNPYAVFPSTRLTFRVNTEMNRLQRPRWDGFDDWILRQYREMYDVFFEERRLIPKGQFHEVGFEELEADPIGEVKRIYEALNLPEFTHAEPSLRAYVNSLAAYQKNRFPDLPPELRQRIATEWRRCFDEWSYTV